MTNSLDTNCTMLHARTGPMLYRNLLGVASLLPMLCLALVSCEPADTTESTQDQSSEDALDRAVAAHGGMEVWQSYGTLAFDIQRGTASVANLVDLKTRKALMTSEDYTIGYDGEQVWITPGLDAFASSPRFYNGLDFYFFAIPFVLADPGTRRESLGRVSVGDEEFDAVRISFDEGVGASPGDYYVAHFDPDTHLLRLLLYTVTFFSGEPNENYNVRMYDEWQEVGGLLVPLTASSYAWDSEAGVLGERRGEASYANVRLMPEPPDAATFARPDGAEVDEAPQAESM